MTIQSKPWLAPLLALCAAATVHAQATAPAPAPKPPAPAVITPAPNLHADGMPEIPASIAEAVGRYTEFRTASFAGWHPARREALILTRFANTNQVHAVRFPGGDRRQLTFFPERVTDASWPRRSGDYFVFTQRPRRRRVRADLPQRRRDRRDHAAQRRRPLAERARALVARRRPHGLRLDAAQRRGPRHLRDRSEESCDRPAPAHSSKAAAGAPRTGRRTTSGSRCSSSFRSTRAISGSRTWRAARRRW